MFVLVNNQMINTASISKIDLSNLEDLKLIIRTMDGSNIEVGGLQVIDILMILRPSALESHRLRWFKAAWAVHNLIGHPVMQILALFGQYKLAMIVHDITVPRPIGRRKVR